MRSSDVATLFGLRVSTQSIFPLAVLTALILPTLLIAPLQAQNLEQVEVGPPPLHRAEPPVPSATAKELESRGDELQSQKYYLDAIDYYQAALRKDPRNAVLTNKVGMQQLLLHRWREARKSFDQAIKLDKKYANAYANLAVVYYEDWSYTKAIRNYDKAIQLDGDEAVFYNNRGAALFAKKQYQKAAEDYAKALQLDPEIFERSSRGPGIQAQLPSPQDIARYDYVLAKLFAKSGSPDRSLHYLKKAMEEGYKDIKNVYKDEEFSSLRKDPRFAELMASKTVAISN
jgi:tetratricopeptide (TPR) repeat protein